jgi:hypothetical protein
VRLYFKNTHYQKRAGGVAQGVGPELRPQYCKKKKKKIKKIQLGGLSCDFSLFM